jgi:hypothetical protein
MTIGINISVNGNYKAPVKVTRDDGSEEHHVVSGFGLDRPSVLYVNHYHGAARVTTVSVGPEEPDNGPEA